MIAKSITYALFAGLLCTGAALGAEPKVEMETLPDALPVAAEVPAQLPEVPAVTGGAANDLELQQQQAAMALIYLLMSSQMNPAQLLR